MYKYLKRLLANAKRARNVKKRDLLVAEKSSLISKAHANVELEMLHGDPDNILHNVVSIYAGDVSFKNTSCSYFTQETKLVHNRDSKGRFIKGMRIKNIYHIDTSKVTMDVLKVLPYTDNLFVDPTTAIRLIEEAVESTKEAHDLIVDLNEQINRYY